MLSNRLNWIFGSLMAFLQMPVASSADIRMFFIGNSITLSGPNSAEGWRGNWGMAASSTERDYVHRVVREVEAKFKTKIEYRALNVAREERQSSYVSSGTARDMDIFNPTHVVLFLGDNVDSDSEGSPRFRSYYRDLVSIASRSGAKVYCVSTWWYSEKKNAVISAECKGGAGRYVDLGRLAGRPGMYAKGEQDGLSKGVGIHPGDFGMEEISKIVSQAVMK